MERIPYTYRLYSFLYASQVNSAGEKLRWLPYIGSRHHICEKMIEKDWIKKCKDYIDLDRLLELAYENGKIDETEQISWEMADDSFALCFGYLKPVIINNALWIEF